MTRHRQTIARALGSAPRALGAAMVSACLSVLPVQARQPEIGARPLGMGEAFLAVADDGNALLWNPAGLPGLGRHELIGSQADVMGTGIETSNLGYLLPLADRYAMGVDWNRLGTDDGELGFEQNSFRWSYGHRLVESLFVGFGLRYLTMDMSLDDRTLAQGSGWGVDLAALGSIGPRVTAALVVRDATDTGLSFEGGGSDTVARRWWRVGLAYRPRPGSTVAVDWDDRLHVGAEYVHRNTLALRVGAIRDPEDPDPFTWTAGVGLRYRFLQLDYAYVVPPSLPADSHFSLHLSFDLSSAKVRVERVDVGEVYPAVRGRYAIHPVGTARLVNRDTRPHQATVSFYMPRWMEFPSEEQLVIRPRETREVPLTGVFSADMAELTEDVLSQAEVKVSYTAEQRTRTHRQPIRIFVYNRNAIIWDDISRAAAFVTSTQPLVARFARPVLVTLEEEVKALGRGSRNLLRAAALFEAVGQHGVRYVADANNPYLRMSADASAVDNVLYPAETLQRRSGDCDDLTVLYCSLLENVGIPTAFVDAPGHIFMMFDSGIPIGRALGLPVAEELYVVRDGRIWIPVEISLFGKSFVEAWRAGAGACVRMAARDRLRVADTATGWEEYEPAPPTFQGRIPPPLDAGLDEAFEAARRQIRELMEEHIRSAYQPEQLESSGDVETRLELAQVYVLIREYERSIEIYGRLEQEGANLARVRNNRGIAHLLGGAAAQAADDFARALEVDPADRGIQANLRLAESALRLSGASALAGDRDGADDSGSKALESDDEQKGLYWR